MAKEKEIPNLVVASKVKEFVQGEELRCASDLAEELSVVVGQMLQKACVRAKENSRGTVRPCDL